MAKAKKSHCFLTCRVVALHKQGLSQRVIAAEGGCRKIVVLNIFLKDLEGYRTIKWQTPKIFRWH